jgi:hypothetical protein
MPKLINSRQPEKFARFDTLNAEDFKASTSYGVAHAFGKAHLGDATKSNHYVPGCLAREDAPDVTVLIHEITLGGTAETFRAWRDARWTLMIACHSYVFQDIPVWFPPDEIAVVTEVLREKHELNHLPIAPHLEAFDTPTGYQFMRYHCARSIPVPRRQSVNIQVCAEQPPRGDLRIIVSGFEQREPL